MLHAQKSLLMGILMRSQVLLLHVLLQLLLLLKVVVLLQEWQCESVEQDESTVKLAALTGPPARNNVWFCQQHLGKLGQKCPGLGH